MRTGRCLPYGSGIVYWALGEVVRGEAGIVDSDSSDEAWAKLGAYVSDVLSEAPGASERSAAQIGRSLGLDVPEELEPPGDTEPQRMREMFFSALRTVIEASARRRPLVLAFEDIHWADDGMLDAIEHLAQWVQAPLLVVCLARDDLLERRLGLGRRAARCHAALPGAAHARHSSRELVTALLGGSGGAASDLVALGGRAVGRQPAVRRGDGAAAGGGGRGGDRRAARTRCRRSWRPGSTRSTPSSGGSCSRRRWWDAPSGRGRSAALAEEEGRPLAPALSALQEKDILAPEAESRLAGEQELAFKHVLIRDVAYGMLPKAVRWRKHFEVGRFIEERAGDRTDEVVALLAEHYGRAARWVPRPEATPDDLADVAERAVRFLEEAGDAAALLYANREAIAHYAQRAGHPGRRRRRGGRTHRREAGRRRAAARAGGCRDGGVGGVPRATTAGEENLERVADLHRKLGAALAVKGERKAAIENYQRGINLLKDGPPTLELVRLYEEAAWLYLQTGDNMLAIYASEKALRLAERLGETARGQPGPRDLRPRVRAYRRQREGAREPGALGRARARLGPGGDDRRPAGPGPPLRALAGRCARRRGRLQRGPRAGRAGR